MAKFFCIGCIEQRFLKGVMPMNEVQILQHDEFGEIRTIEIDGQIYFVSHDIANALGYTNPRKAILDHVDEEDKIIFNLNTVPIQNGIRKRGNPNVTIINESGLYSLVLASKIQRAKKFKRWVTSEVLPTIRKTGSYNPNPSRIEEKTTVFIENANFYIGSIGNKSNGNVKKRKMWN